MNVCPKCQTKNQESSNFCKKCGFKLAGSAFQDKKKKVLGEKKGRSPWLLVSLALIVVFLGGTAFWIIQDKSVANPKVSSQPKVSEEINYSGQTIRMTDITAKVENGRISIPLETVMGKRMVYFEYVGNGVKTPLLTYITQTGKVVTAVSMCEPCRSTRFHIKGNTLVCNACGTEWTLETLKGIQGGCLGYPPDPIPSTVEKGQILIDEKIIAQWKPRV